MDNEPSGAAVGLTAFAAFMLMLAGIFQIIWGVTAIAEDEFIVATPKYVFEFDVTTWGWIHLLMGIIVALAGVYLFRGAVWARLIAVIVAGLSAIANFLTIPYSPLWSLAIVTLNVFIIWAVTSHGRDITKA
jgi:hypothetical protein